MHGVRAKFVRAALQEPYSMTVYVIVQLKMTDRAARDGLYAVT
jgi:hypothetical protein